jgi:hypothetical protein
MVKVRMLTSVASARYAFRSGEEVNASPQEAAAWIADGVAELVTETRIETPERGQRSERRRKPD